MNDILPLVSITCITYNQETFIRQCIDGFLMQKTTFPFEIIIHDDASTDGTITILKEYAVKYSNLVIPIFQKENVYSKGTDPLFEFVLPICRGRYIAFCEGDDYWTDPMKLQMQIDFLEANSRYSASVHQSEVIYEDGSSANRLVSPYKQSRDIRLDDLIDGCYFQTGSLVFRKLIWDNAVDFPEDITSTDRALFFLCSLTGPIRFFDSTMSVYRKHDGGLSSRVTVDLMKKDLDIIPWLMKMNPDFPKNLYLAHLHYSIFAYAASIKNSLLIKHYFLHLWFSILSYPRSKSKIVIARKHFLGLVKQKIRTFYKKLLIYRLYIKLK